MFVVYVFLWQYTNIEHGIKTEYTPRTQLVDIFNRLPRLDGHKTNERLYNMLLDVSVLPKNFFF